MTSPHQLPSISQSRERHTRRISTKLTSGTSIPIDFKASLVHIVHNAFIVDQIVDSPRTATSAALPAARGALIPAAPDQWSELSSAAAGKVDMLFSFRRHTKGEN